MSTVPASSGINAELQQALIRHATYLQRYGSGLTKRISALLDKADADLTLKLQARLAKAIDTGPESTKRLEDMLVEIRAMNRAAYESAGKELTAQLRDLSSYELEWSSGFLKDALPVAVQLNVPPLRSVAAAALSRPFQGRLLKEVLSGLEASKAAKVRDAIRLGVIEGETVDQIVRRVRGTKALRYADGVMEIGRREAGAVVRTAVNHISDYTRERLYQDNADLVKGIQWLATLDGRTCPTCAALDGKTFPLDKGPRAPRHFGCRCTRVPLLKSWRELGIDSDEWTPASRASMNGQVPEKITYSEWLKTQSDAFQDELLGKGRAELFRSGVPIDRFVDRAGTELSLKRLRQADPPQPSPRPNGTGFADVPATGSRLTAAQVAAEADAIDYVRNNGLRDKIEYAAAYFEDGSVGLRKAGEASSVSFTDREFRALAGTTMVHNHPRGTSLSGADLIFQARGQLREIVAVPSEGGGLFRAAALLSWGEVSEAHQAAARYVLTRLRAAFADGRLTEKQFDSLYAHLTNQTLDHAKVVAYKASLTPAMEDAVAAFGAERVKEVVEGFKWK